MLPEASKLVSNSAHVSAYSLLDNCSMIKAISLS